MRYFIIAYILVAVLIVGMLGFRGQHFSKPPIQIFNDMDNQDKLKAQSPDGFFADRQGARQPVSGTQPLGFNETGKTKIGNVREYEFGGQTGYYYTGHVGDYFGTGMPDELELNSEESASELIKRGKERYGIYCAVCHGDSGNGAGMTSRYGVPAIANLHQDTFKSAVYPDGRIFEVISNGKGLMSGYKANIPVRDRWAIISYVRTLQAAKEAATAAK
jgi:mono/diheme cytochrome c family protein